MTEFFAAISQKQAALTSSGDWQNEDYNGTGQGATNVHQEPEIDLKEAFERILGASAEGAEELDDSVKERRLDLLVWLMNLELRLSPYGEPA